MEIVKSIETKESCMEAYREHIALRDTQIVGSSHWRTLDLDCMEISTKCMRLGADQKVLSRMLRNEKTKLPETPEERIYALEIQYGRLKKQLEKVLEVFGIDDLDTPCPSNAGLIDSVDECGIAISCKSCWERALGDVQ